MNETGNEAENRAARQRQTELLADVIRVRTLAFPVPGAKWLGQLGANPGIPAFVDAVQYARQLRGIGTTAKQTLKPAAEFRGGDLLGVGLADGCEMGSVNDSAFEEGQFVVELEAIDMERVLGGTDPSQRLLWEQALVGQIVDGENGGDLGGVPGEVSRHKRSLPVIDVNQIRCPILVQSACRKLGRGRGESPEAHIIVRPVPARRIAVGVAGAVIELRAQQDVNRQAVSGRCQPERTCRHLRQRRALTNDLYMQELFDDVSIARQQDPDVAPGA